MRAFLMVLVGCGGGQGNALPSEADCSPAPGGALPTLALEEVASGLVDPVGLVAAHGEERLFVVEQGGRVRTLADGVLADDLLDVSARVTCCGEQGLLGLAFHPDFRENGRFFVYYTNQQGAQVVMERGGDGSERELLVMEDEFGNHNGGALAFGGDGLLYVATGDGGGGGDPHESGQNPLSLEGKILRLDVERMGAPAGNYPGGAGEVWDIGLRNPWRVSFDLCTGDLYIGDVGQGSREEVDVEPVGQGHRNYGWDVNEGTQCYYDDGDPMPCPMMFTPPAVDYDHAQGCSVTGGYVYRGASIPGLRGRYFYGDYCTRRIWSFLWKDGAATDLVDHTADLASETLIDGLSSFGQDDRGELYLVSHRGGRLFRIVAE